MDFLSTLLALLMTWLEQNPEEAFALLGGSTVVAYLVALVRRFLGARGALIAAQLLEIARKRFAEALANGAPLAEALPPSEQPRALLRYARETSPDAVASLEASEDALLKRTRAFLEARRSGSF